MRPVSQSIQVRWVALTICAACGSGAGPAAPGPTPEQAHHVMVVERVPPDAYVPPPPPPPPPQPKLGCADGTHVQPAAAPEPTWFCVRDDGKRDGRFFSLFPDGAIAIEGSFKADKLDGAWTRHYPSGAIAETGAFVDGRKDGAWKQLSPVGAELGSYAMKLGTGTEKRWYDEGPLYSERAFKNGALHGAAKVYTPDGQIAISSHYWLGKLDDKHEFGSKATMRFEETYERGIRSGKRKIWQFWLLYVEDEFDRGGRNDGDITVWRTKDIPRFKGQFKHGKRDGVWTWTDGKNKKEKEGAYVDGKRDGAWAEWNGDNLAFTGTYVAGKPDGDFVYYDKSGNELGRFTMKDGTGTWETFWPNKKPSSKEHWYKGEKGGAYQELTNRGKVTLEGHYAGNMRHGGWKEWNADGTVLNLEQTFKRNRLDGKVVKYVDGKPSVESHYKDGKAEGAYVELRNGKPAVTGQFAGDLRVGAWTYLDENGQVALACEYKAGLLDGAYKETRDGIVTEGTMVAGRRSGTWKRTDKAGTSVETTYSTP